MPRSVRDNEKYRCRSCGGILHISHGATRARCPSCGSTHGFEQIRVTTVCDFCSTPDGVQWSYPCRDFPNPLLGTNSMGGWAACDGCKDAVDRDDRRALADRWLDRNLAEVPLPREVAFIAIRELHDRFFENRLSDRAYHVPDPDNPNLDERGFPL